MNQLFLSVLQTYHRFFQYLVVSLFRLLEPLLFHLLCDWSIFHWIWWHCVFPFSGTFYKSSMSKILVFTTMRVRWSNRSFTWHHFSETAFLLQSGSWRVEVWSGSELWLLHRLAWWKNPRRCDCSVSVHVFTPAIDCSDSLMDIKW